MSPSLSHIWVSGYLGVWDRDILGSLVVGVIGIISLESYRVEPVSIME